MIFLPWINGFSEWVSGGETTFTFPDRMKALDPFRDKLTLLKGVRYQNLKDTPNPEEDAADDPSRLAAVPHRRIG